MKFEKEKKITLNLRIEDDVNSELERISKEENTKKSEVARAFIKKGIEEYNKKNK